MKAYLEKCLPYWSRSGAQLSWFHFQPFKWPLDSQVPVLSSKWSVRLQWYCNVVLLFMYNGCVTLRAFPILSNPAESIVTKFFLLFTIVSYAFGMTGCIQTAIMGPQLTTFVQSYIKFLEDGDCKSLIILGENYVQNVNKIFCLTFNR